MGAPSSDQGEVWREVSRKLGAMGSFSSSSDLHQAYADHEGRLSFILGELPAPEGCCGAVFAFSGRIAGADLFDKPTTLTKLWNKLIRAYAIDALEVPEDQQATVTVAAVQEWLQSAGRAKMQPFKSPGLGEDVRLHGDHLVGAGLVVEEQPVHVELFAENEAKA
jgi:hypothetical protein